MLNNEWNCASMQGSHTMAVDRLENRCCLANVGLHKPLRAAILAIDVLLVIGHERPEGALAGMVTFERCDELFVGGQDTVILYGMGEAGAFGQVSGGVFVAL